MGKRRTIVLKYNNAQKGFWNTLGPSNIRYGKRRPLKNYISQYQSDGLETDNTQNEGIFHGGEFIKNIGNTLYGWYSKSPGKTNLRTQPSMTNEVTPNGGSVPVGPSGTASDINESYETVLTTKSQLRDVPGAYQRLKDLAGAFGDRVSKFAETPAGREFIRVAQEQGIQAASRAAERLMGISTTGSARPMDRHANRRISY